MNVLLTSLISAGAVSPPGIPDVAMWTIPVIAIGSVVGGCIVIIVVIYIALKLLKR